MCARLGIVCIYIWDSSLWFRARGAFGSAVQSSDLFAIFVSKPVTGNSQKRIRAGPNTNNLILKST